MGGLPERIDARRWADQARECSGTLATEQLSRLRESVISVLGPAQVSLKFWRDKDGRLRASGEIGARVQLTCQRCLEPMRVDLDVTVRAAIVASDEQARHLPEELDPWLLDQDELDVLTMVEDELILALPAIARHDLGECDNPAPASDGFEEGDREPGPFAGLAEWKRNN